MRMQRWRCRSVKSVLAALQAALCKIAVSQKSCSTHTQAHENKNAVFTDLVALMVLRTRMTRGFGDICGKYSTGSGLIG